MISISIIQLVLLAQYFFHIITNLRITINNIKKREQFTSLTFQRYWG